MEFSKSGLPRNQLLEDAFNYSRQQNRADYEVMLETFNTDIEMLTKNRLMVLNASKEAGKIKPEEYDQQKKKFEQEREQYLKAGPQLINQHLEEIFEARNVVRAKEALASSNGSTQFAAIAMLIDCVRSPIDHENVVKRFGKDIAGVVGEIAHIDAYPGQREKNLSQASADTKRVFLISLLADTNLLVSRVERSIKANPGKKPPAMGPDQEKKAFADLKPLWGNDPKLDAKFVDSFNKLTALTLSAYKLEVVGGNVALVQNAAGAQDQNQRPRNNKPTGPKSPDDVF